MKQQAHGGKIAMPATAGQHGNRLEYRVFRLTIKGIYGRNVWIWYKATMMIESGMDITPVVTHRFV